MKSNIPTDHPHATRTGKIARLPRAIRQQLNLRLEDGESNQNLVAWLNENEAVRKRLAEYYAGRPITEQNLSDWKQGGFLDWQRHEETGVMVREFLGESEDLGADLGGEMVVERAVNMVAAVLLRLFHEAAVAESGPQQRQAVLEIARELARLRRGDQQRQRMRLLAERQRVELKEKEEARQQRKKEEKAQHLAALRTQWEWYDFEMTKDRAALTPERLEMIKEFYCDHEEELLEAGITPLPRADVRAGPVATARGPEVQSNRA